MVLAPKKIEHAKEGMHADGGGLYLRVQASGAKSWIFRFQLNSRRREMGIGTLADKHPKVARAEAANLGQMVRNGIDPIEARKAAKEDAAAAAKAVERGAVTFSMAAKAYIEAHRSGWKNPKHAAQWPSTLETYVYPVFGGKPVGDVTTDDVLRALHAIWVTKTDTALRVRSRIELVLSYAKAKKWREGENPAAWRGNLDALLPKPSAMKKANGSRHQPALPYERMAEFMVELRKIESIGARALEFAILTATRSGETRLATWGEFNLKSKVWIIPKERMKAGREHRVALSFDAVQLIQRIPKLDGNDYVFPGGKDQKPLSDMALTAITRRMNAGDHGPVWIDPKNNSPIVPHGFRSTFRDWAAEKTNFPHEMAEMALSHAVGDKVEAAYRRGDMFERRLEMMEAWAEWCVGRSAKVIQLQGKRRKKAV